MPLVSVIVPCYNEQETICLLLEAIAGQTFPCRELEIIIADGRSEDQTISRIADFQQTHPEVTIRVVENPRRYIPAGLNCALEEARGAYILRIDGHSIPAPDYIQLCVADLQAGKGENVGGVWEIRPSGEGLMQRAIALAAAHPFGVGDARYRYTREAGYVDTVPFGAFKREVFERYGRFDESLLSNEDYEFNARLIRNGGRVWLNPAIRSTYFARGDLKALSKQYGRYGFWKYRMLRRYPATLRWRQALPAAFVLGLALLVLALLPGITRPYAAGLLAIALGFYALALSIASLSAARRAHDWRLGWAIPLAMAAMHVSWGAGFWWSLFKGGFGVKLQSISG